MAPPVNITGYLERIQPSGSERHARFELHGNWAKFGRGYNNDLVLPLLTISRHHAEFQYRDDHWEIKDLSQNGICINYERVTCHDYVVLENNDIISFVPGGSVDYRFISGGTLQNDSNPTEGQMSPPLLPAVPGPSTSRATMMSPNNISGIALKRVRVVTEESSQQTEVSVPTFDDGSSSIRSAETELFPRWTGSPSVSCLGTPAYCYDAAAEVRRQNSTQANQLRHCQERIENLESEIQRLHSERDNLQRDLDRAGTETQGQMQGQLVQVLEDDLTCVICSDVLIEPTVVECGHVFCSHCITVWIEERRNQSNSGPNCPSCRTEIDSPRRVRGWDSFFSSVYKLLPTEAQKNREEILQQRHDQHEGWEAEQVVQRAEQEEARQRRLEEERARAERQARAEARARFNADRASVFLYNRLLQRYMAEESRESNSNDSPVTHAAPPEMFSLASDFMQRIRQQPVQLAAVARQSDIVVPPSAAPVVRSGTSVTLTPASVIRPPSATPAPARPVVRLATSVGLTHVSVARPPPLASRPAHPVAPSASSVAPPAVVTQSITVVRPLAPEARRLPSVATATATESIRQGHPSEQAAAADSSAGRNENPENNWSRLSIQDAFRALDMSDPVLQLHPVDAPNPSSSASRTGENTARRSITSYSRANNRETQRTGTRANNNADSGGPRSSADSSASRLRQSSSRVAAEQDSGPALNSSTVQSLDMPPPHDSTGHYDQQVGTSGENQPRVIIRLGSLAVAGNERNLSVSGSQNGSQEELRAIRIPPLAVHPSRVVRSPAPDRRVPSPAPSLASNSSNLSDPFARAGGIPHIGNPLLPEVPARVGNNLGDEPANQLGMDVGQNERNEPEQEAAGQQPQRQGLRNVARRGRPFQPGASDRSAEMRRSSAPTVGSVRAESRARRHRRHGSHRLERRAREHLSDDEARILSRLLNYLGQPPSETRVSSGRRSGRSRSSNEHPARNDSPEIIHLDPPDSPDPEIIDDDLQILYESSHPLS